MFRSGSRAGSPGWRAPAHLKLASRHTTLHALLGRATGLEIGKVDGPAEYRNPFETRPFSGQAACLAALTHINFAWMLLAHAGPARPVGDRLCAAHSSANEQGGSGMNVPHRVDSQPAPWLLGIDHLMRIRQDQLGFYAGMREAHGDIVRLRLGPYRSHLLFHPDHVEALLTRQWASFIRFRKLTKVVHQWNGDSVLLAEGEEWRTRRRKVMPAFQTKRLPAYGAMAVHQTGKLCDDLASRASGGRIRFDTDAVMARLTLDIATRTLFGAAPRDNGDEIERAIQVLSATAFSESTSPFLLPDWLPLPAKRRKLWAMHVMDDLVCGLVRERMGPRQQRRPGRSARLADRAARWSFHRYSKRRHEHAHCRARNHRRASELALCLPCNGT